jgi:hypothetical protein
MNNRSIQALVGRATVVATVLAGFLAFTAVPRLNAADDDCQRRISKADHRLHEAIEHHGRESRQAEYARRELHEARERCWNNGHRWWDQDQHKWRTERDWDDRDHDRDDRH